MKDPQMPLYVTRETATGTTGSLSLNAYAAVVVWIVVVLNVFVWGLIGLWKAFELVF